MIYLDTPRGVGAGKRVVRVWTDGDHDELHALCMAVGISRERYRPPQLVGCSVVAGGYYVLSSPQHQDALTRAGAVRVGELPDEIDLVHLICIGQAAVRGQRQGQLFDRAHRPAQPRPPGLSERWRADTQRQKAAGESPELTVPQRRRERRR